MLLRSFQFTVFLALLVNVCLAQDKLPAKETTSNKIYFEFKPASGVIIKAGAKDTAFYDLDEALGVPPKYASFYCRVTKDSIAVSLPYANASFSRSVNPEHPGINFNSRIYSCDLVSESEDNYKITVQTKDLVLNNYVLIFIVKGRSVFCMVKNKRIGMIGFFGTLKKI